MTSVESGQQTERRRKRLATAVGVGLAATLVAVGWGWWGNLRRAGNPRRTPRSLPANLNQELSGYSFTRSYEGHRVFTIHAAKTQAFEHGGSTVLQDVWVEFFGREGNRHDILRTRECEYNPQTGSLTAAGKAEMVLNADALSSPAGGSHRQPAFLETSNISFEQQDSLVVTEEPVEFHVGPASGYARGLKYSTRDGGLELGSNVAVDFRVGGDRGGEAPGHLTASRLQYVKSSGEVWLAGPVEVVQGRRQATAGQGVVHLDSGGHVTQAVLTGGVRASDRSAPGESGISAPSMRADFGPNHRLQAMRAEGGVEGFARRQGRETSLRSQTLEVHFAGARPDPEQGTATGGVRIISEPLAAAPLGPGNGDSSAVGSSRDELTAEGVEFSFRPGGWFLRDARTDGPGKIVLLPTSPKQGGRDIKADALAMGFDLHGRLSRLDGAGRCQIVFLPAAQAPQGTPADETSSDRFDAVFAPETGSLKSLTELGNFRLREGDRQASAERARYDPSGGTMALDGRPLVWDPEARIRADTVRMGMSNGTAEGRGHVEATHWEAAGASPGVAANEPTHVVAERMTAERNRRVVQYEGNVRAWHGGDVLESAQLDIFDAERRIASPTPVVTSHLAPGALVPALAARDSDQTEVRPVVIRADRLDYSDRERKAIYRGDVELETQGARLRADLLEAYFSAATGDQASEIERAVADRHVVVTRETRRATGGHAQYWAKDDKIELTDGPPTLYEPGKNFITGRRLTFFLDDDRVRVDGDAASPTFSKHRIPK